MIKQEEIFRNGVALLAFVMAFYALVARERKTPYIVHSVYTITLIVLFSLLLSFGASFLVEPEQQVSPTIITAGTVPSPSWKVTVGQWGQRGSATLLAFGLIYILYKIFREWNRHLNFRDDEVFKMVPPVRAWRWLRDRVTPPSKARYNYNPLEIPDGLLTSLKQSPFFESSDLDAAIKHHENAKPLSISAVFKVGEKVTLDKLVVDLSVRFLESKCFVQYTSCSRHPVEFLLHLKSEWAKKEGIEQWEIICKKVIVVDGYTPHFGFTDSVYTKWTEHAKENCLDVVESKATYAGVHSAIAQAFNKLKDTDHKHVRTPTLVIYERCAALIDLESNEQYRIFVRHVIPSERLWGGMFSLFVESEISKDNQPVLAGCADLFVEIPKPKEESK